MEGSPDWVDLGVGYILRWFTHPQMLIVPSTNWARRRVTLLMEETNTLPLSQTATCDLSREDVQDAW